MTTTSLPGNTAEASYRGPKVSCLLLDFPWDIQQQGHLGAGRHYEILGVERLKQFPVPELLADDAHVWMWVTNATLEAGYALAHHYGLTVRSPLTWIKPRFTLGNYLRNATEHLLLMTKGKAPVQFKAQPTWMFAPLQDHSHKPEEQYAVIERVSGPGLKLECFARRRPPEFPGTTWLVWGNEIDSDIRIPGWPVPSDFDEQEVTLSEESGREG